MLIGWFFIWDKIRVIILSLLVEVLNFNVIFIFIVKIMFLKIVLRMMFLESVWIGIILRNKVVVVMLIKL